MRILLETVDLVRIDHFRDFDQYWAIPAEDLGLITTEVNSMRNECGFPGMKVLQFAF